jgi:membrane protein
VTGLAAEAAFFAVLSVPPLVFALAGMIGYVTDQFSATDVDQVRQAVFVLYILAIITGVLTLPLVVAGPSLVRRVLPESAEFLVQFYWPTVIVLSVCFLATLYHVSVPVRTNWSFNLPGATFALAAWILGSFLLRWILTETAADSKSIYGPLASPIAVLLWLYLLSLAVLIGAAVNAAFDTVFPQKATTSARLELVQRLRERMTPGTRETH